METTTTPQTWADALLRCGIASELVESVIRQGIASPRHFIALTETPARLTALARRLRVSEDRVAEVRQAALDAFPDAATPTALHFGERLASGLMPEVRREESGQATLRTQLMNHYREFAPLASEEDDEPIDHRDKCDPVGDQLDIGSCWVWGTLTMVSVILWLAGGKAFKRLSPKFLFQDVKANGKDAFPDTDGGRPENACDALLDIGCCTEETYPYEKPIDRDTVPPTQCYTEAAELNLPLREFVELPTDSGVDRELLRGILRGTSALQGRAVTGGLPIYPSFFDTDESGYVMDPTPEEREWGPAGYHLMAIVGTFVLEVNCGSGRVVRLRYYAFRNSWGIGFGDAGDVYISENYAHDMLMCCLAMFHTEEVEAWQEATLREPTFAVPGPHDRDESSSGALAQILLLTLVLCGILAALSFFARPLLAARSRVPTPARRESTRGWRKNNAEHGEQDDRDSHQGKPEQGPTWDPKDAPTWSELRQKLARALSD